MSAGFKVKDLNRLAGTLAQGAERLAGLSGDAPAMPDAGASSPVIGDALAVLGTVMSTITKTAANAADQAQANATQYVGSDENNAADLGKIRGPH